MKATLTMLQFNLDIHDDWPPVSTEEVPCEVTSRGYRISGPPLFVKDLAVGDVIAIERAEEGKVLAWKHIMRSAHTTIWVARTGADSGIEEVLVALRGLGCSTANLQQAGVYAVDVPETVPISQVDECLKKLDPNRAAVAYPAFRHPEPAT